MSQHEAVFEELPFEPLAIEALSIDKFGRFSMADFKEFTYLSLDYTERLLGVMETMVEDDPKPQQGYEAENRRSIMLKLEGALNYAGWLAETVDGLALTPTWRRPTSDVLSRGDCQQAFDDLAVYVRTYDKSHDTALRELGVRLLIGREWYGRAEWPYKPLQLGLPV